MMTAARTLWPHQEAAVGDALRGIAEHGGWAFHMEQRMR